MDIAGYVLVLLACVAAGSVLGHLIARALGLSFAS